MNEENNEYPEQLEDDEFEKKLDKKKSKDNYSVRNFR